MAHPPSQVRRGGSSYFDEKFDPADEIALLSQMINPSTGAPFFFHYESVEAVRKEASSRSQQIWKNWHLLNDILARHEATVQKRWRKKSIQARQKLLLSAWPDKPPSHRPDLEVFRRGSALGLDLGAKDKGAYMWPYINLEDLCTPRALLLLLNARGRTTPDAFIFADLSSTVTGSAAGVMQLGFLTGYTMMFIGRKDPESYGELIDWVDLPEAKLWMQYGKGCQPGEGLIILEVQDRIWSFLVDCCKQILHDISADMLLDAKYPVQVAPPSISEYGLENASLATLAAETPYRAPARLDLARLEALLETKLTEAKDHLWALREDPGYFEETVDEFKEHHFNSIPDTNGHTYREWKYSQRLEFWRIILGNVIRNAYMSIEHWSGLFEQVSVLRSLHQKYSSHISIEEQLPEDLLDALLHFKVTIEAALDEPTELLVRSVTACPEMRQFHYRRSIASDGHRALVDIKPSAPIGQVRDYLLRLSRTFGEKSWHDIFFRGLLADEIERLIQKEGSAKALVSPFVARVFSEVSLLVECSRQVMNFNPWAKGLDSFIKARNLDAAKPEYAMFLNWERTRVVTLGNPEDGKFFYPADKRVTKESAIAMRKAEKNLDLLWEAVDRHTIIGGAMKVVRTAIGKFQLAPSMLRRTPEWVETKKENRALVTLNKAETLIEPMSSIYVEQRQQNNNTLDATMRKSKEKTRGVPRSPKADYQPSAEGDDSPQSEQQTQTKITVDKKAYKVFSTLFHDPASSSQPGEIPWLQFCHAMRSAGFNAEKLYGSVWSFQPVDPGSKSGINFHEPHPSGKLPFREARRYGRRLGRRYGWHIGTFELAA
ncbi:hypothetical protein C1H76_0285 [Elsinoe australis]|uniref:Uncharacterized protein n=1 Tax=Elsinoe australis TaxID=40998 RepID=A0A4U7B7I9_9PEZI|nr:hypothetical protein C1H76_0285 [Elsinoe australis]